MAFVINDGCVSCGACAGQCPVGAIAEGDGKFEIDAATCISCGSCAGCCPNTDNTWMKSTMENNQIFFIALRF